MVSDYKQKYLKYKIKYLNAKKKFRGGSSQALSDDDKAVLAEMDSAGCPKLPLNEVYNILTVLGEGSIPRRETDADQATKTQVRLIIANKFTEIITKLKTALEELAKKEDNNFIKNLEEAKESNEAFHGTEYNPSEDERGIINKWAADQIKTLTPKPIPDFVEFIKETINGELEKNQTTTVINKNDTLYIEKGREQYKYALEPSKK